MGRDVNVLNAKKTISEIIGHLINQRSRVFRTLRITDLCAILK
jgi:hypothetical protein